jgi:hypothetical protein
MNTYFKLRDALKTVINEEPFNNTVTSGNIANVMAILNKQVIFPLANIQINSSTVDAQTISYNVTIFYLDLVDFSKAEETDLFNGNDNTDDVIATQEELSINILRKLQRDSRFNQDFEIFGAMSLEHFEETLKDKLAGVAATLDIVMKTDMTIC